MAQSRTFEMSLLEGEWPKEIRGHHWINGPGKRLPWQQHSIFAPGVLQRFDLQPDAGGELRWHVRDTHAYDVQAALAHLDVFEDPRAFQVLGGPLLTGLNNSFFLIDDRVFLTADFNRPWEIDPGVDAAGHGRRPSRVGRQRRLALLSPLGADHGASLLRSARGAALQLLLPLVPRDGTSLARHQRPAPRRHLGRPRRGAPWEVPGRRADAVRPRDRRRRATSSCCSSRRSFQIEPGIALARAAEAGAAPAGLQPLRRPQERSQSRRTACAACRFARSRFRSRRFTCSPTTRTTASASTCG